MTLAMTLSILDFLGLLLKQIVGNDRCECNAKCVSDPSVALSIHETSGEPCEWCGRKRWNVNAHGKLDVVGDTYVVGVGV